MLSQLIAQAEPVGLHRLVLCIPVVSTILATLFSIALFRRWRMKGGGLHLLWWGLGFVTFALGTFTEAWTSLFGWNPVIFRTWYIVGAFLGGYPLAQGSIYLLMNRRFGHVSVALAMAVIVAGSVLVCLTPLDTAAAESHRLSGEVIVWSKIRLISPFINLYALVFLAGGAIYSAWLFKRNPKLRSRHLGNILIAVGAILPGIGGPLTRFGHVEALYITEFCAICLIYGGYRLCIRKPVGARHPSVVAELQRA